MKKRVLLLVLCILFLIPINISALEIKIEEPRTIHIKKNTNASIDFNIEENIDTSKIEWANSHPTIASISLNNKLWVVKGLNYGSTRLVGYYEGMPKFTLLIQVFDGLVFLNTTEQIDINEPLNSELALQPSASLEEFEPTYTSSDKTIASVNSQGIITGHKIGKVTITADYLGQKATKKIEVIDKPDFEFSESQLAINVDSSVNIPYKISLFGNVDKKITWKSLDESVATVNQRGVVYGVNQGSTTISAFVNGNEYLLVLRVIKNIERIDLGEKNITLNVKDEFEIPVKIAPEQYSDIPITWTSSKPSIAKVAGGKILAVSTGEAIITAKVNEIEESISVVVNEPLTGLVVNPSRITLQQGGRYHLRVSPKPTTSNTVLNLKYTSSDPNIATVDDFGNISAMNQGKTYVFVQHGEFSASVEVNVTFAEDETGQKKMTGSLDANQEVTFDLRGVENVADFALEIPLVSHLNQDKQLDVTVVLDELSFNENRLLVSSLQLSEKYKDKDIHLKVFNHKRILLFEYVFNQFHQVNQNLFPNINTIESHFNNFDGHLIEVFIPINLSNRDRLIIKPNFELEDDLRLYNESGQALRLVTTRNLVDQELNQFTFSNLKNDIYYLTNLPIQSRLGLFLLVVFGMIALITSFFMIKRYNKQSIQFEKQERSRNESINFKQTKR